jgi:hypothetical protein
MGITGCGGECPPTRACYLLVIVFTLAFGGT